MLQGLQPFDCQKKTSDLDILKCKCPYFAEYIGFFFNDISEPNFGSIVLKKYDTDLLEYSVHSNIALFIEDLFKKRKQNNRDTKDINIEEILLENDKYLNEREKNPQNQIIILVDILYQIAQGTINYFYTYYKRFHMAKCF